MNFISKDFSDNIPWQKLNFRQVFSFYSAHHWSSLPLKIKFNNNRTCWYGLRLRCSTCLAPFQLKKNQKLQNFSRKSSCSWKEWEVGKFKMKYKRMKLRRSWKVAVGDGVFNWVEKKLFRLAFPTCFLSWLWWFMQKTSIGHKLEKWSVTISCM